VIFYIFKNGVTTYSNAIYFKTKRFLI